MAESRLLTSVKYITDAEGKKTDVVIPVEVWEALLASLEDQSLGQVAKAALQNSQRVGSEAFVAELCQLAALDNSD